MGYYSATQGNEVLTEVTIWMSCENTTLNERSQTGNITCYDSTGMRCPEWANLQRRKIDQWLPEAGRESGEENG